MHRLASPALSENEVDISKSLFQGEAQHDSDNELGLDHDSDLPLGRRKLGIDGSDAEDDEPFIAATQVAANRKNGTKMAKKVGAFQAMGLSAHLLKAITKKGFAAPTDIQKRTIPLILDGRDVAGMARTGSGKTAAFVIPMIEKLKSHSVQIGARALILSPTRELASQTLKVVKEFGKGTDLSSVLLVGGDSLEEQFRDMANNPDIIVATPGRFEHVKIEMGLNLSSVKYVVFDEADRLFEMGFKVQLDEIINALPESRQTLLFSATLPTSLVEFFSVRLKDPKLERLDADQKIPPGLESTFFTIKRSEKEGALLHILQDIINLPVGRSDAARNSREHSVSGNKKRKRGATDPLVGTTPLAQSTIVFAATKYHVEYLVSLLKAFGYSVSYAYSTLDQMARDSQITAFKEGITNIMVATEIAGRGLDIPMVGNVINYDFSTQPKNFVHRVGRTARAGKAGWSYSLVTQSDMPYLVDLQLFLSRSLIVGRGQRDSAMFKDSIVIGSMVRDKLDLYLEEVSKLLGDDEDLLALREVARRGEERHVETRNAPSGASIKRAKQLTQKESLNGINMLFDTDEAEIEQQRMAMLSRVSGFRPQETVFELGRKGAASEAANIMRKRRARIGPKHRTEAGDEEHGTHTPRLRDGVQDNEDSQAMDIDSEQELILTAPGAEHEQESEDEAELVFSTREQSQMNRSSTAGWQDSEHFMAYAPANINLSEDRSYGVHSGASSNFMEAARSATMDLANDETKAFGEPSRASALRWDKKSKKYVAKANDVDGSKGAKMMRGESGQKIPASFQSGRFDAWRKANKIDRLPKVGEMERKGAHSASNNGPRYKHKMVKAPKAADKYRDDYHKRKKRVDEAKQKRVGRFADGKGKNELKGTEDVTKARKLKAKRREKNARPSR